MPSYLTPKINTQYIFYISLVSQADTKVFQANPTIAAGDFKVATNDGAPGNPATIPVVDADFTKRVKVTLSAAEMNGDNVTLICSDAAGGEWCDLTVNLQTTANQIDDANIVVPDPAGTTPTAVENRQEMDSNSTRLDADVSSRAPSGEYDTQLDATITSRSSHTAANVWAVGSRTLTSFGTLIADIWANVTRTLTALTAGAATEAKQDTAQLDLDKLTGTDGAILATSQPNYAPSKAGDSMNLADNAIEAGKYDELTAFPVKSADTGATQIARTGSDGDTLETLSDQIDLQATLAINTEGRLSELDAANLPSDIDDIKTKTDNLPSGISKNVALPDFEFLMVDSTDHVSGKTGLTVSGTISKDGGAFGALTNSVAEVSAGIYKVDLTQAEMNVDTLTLKFTAVDADQRTITIFTS